MLTWSALFGLVALVVLATAIFLWTRQNMNRRAASAASIVEEQVVEKRIVSAFESPSEDAALALVKQALTIREPAGVAGCFHPGTASPEEVIGFLSGMEAADGPIEGMTWIGSIDANGLLLDAVVVKTSLGGKSKNRLAILTPDENGKWKIDFDAFARRVKPSWSELLEKNAPSGLVRVIVAEDNYYNGPFSDDSQWACYGMVSPDTELVMLGYCRKDSPQARAMKRIVSGDDATPGAAMSKRATLEIRRVEGGASRQFEITRVLAEDWVVSGQPFDSRFQ